LVGLLALRPAPWPVPIPPPLRLKGIADRARASERRRTAAQLVGRCLRQPASMAPFP
jgi:hypothetical protein